MTGITHDLTFSEGPDSDDGQVFGPRATSKVGFYGATPVVQQVVPTTTPTVQEIIAALVALGLVVQHD